MKSTKQTKVATTVRLLPKVHDAAKKAAEKEKRSLSAHLESLIEKGSKTK